MAALSNTKQREDANHCFMISCMCLRCPIHRRIVGRERTDPSLAAELSDNSSSEDECSLQMVPMDKKREQHVSCRIAPFRVQRDTLPTLRVSVLCVNIVRSERHYALSDKDVSSRECRGESTETVWERMERWRRPGATEAGQSHALSYTTRLVFSAFPMLRDRLTP